MSMARPFSEYRKRLMAALHTHGPSDYVTLAKLADVPELWALRNIDKMRRNGVVVRAGLIQTTHRRRPRVAWGLPAQAALNLSHTLQQGWYTR